MGRSSDPSDEELQTAREAVVPHSEVKAGDVFTNPRSGLSFTVKKIRKSDIVVDVDRVTRKKTGEQDIAVHEREVPRGRWAAFAFAYPDKD